MYNSETDITDILLAWNAGEPQALDRLAPRVYAELQRIARDQFARESKGHTLEPAALINEAYLYFAGRHQVQWRNRDHFFGFAAQQMRRILVDHARKKRAAKRGGSASELPLEEHSTLVKLVDEDILRLNDALKDLERFNPEGCRVVEMRFFGGLKRSEIARTLGVSASTVRNRWQAAKAWLYKELKPRETTSRALGESR